MRIRINQLPAFAAPVLAAIALSAALPAVAQRASESGPTDVDRRWIPSLSFQGSAMVQYMNSGVSSRCLFGRPAFKSADGVVNRPACRDPDANYVDLDASGNPIPNPQPGPSPLRDSSDGDDATVTPTVSASLQLLTPRVDVVPGGPRFFVSGEVITFWGQERDIAKEGSPTGVVFPPPQSGSGLQNALRYTQRGLFGSGSKTQSEVQMLGFGARAGVAFPFQFRERRMWVKPSIDWIQYEVDVRGTVVAGLKDDGLLQGGSALGNPAPYRPNNGAGDFLERGPGIRAVNLFGSGSKVFNGIGPGIEIEMETGRFGPLGVSIFFSAEAFSVLGNRSVSFSSSVRCDPANGQPCPSQEVNDIVEYGDLPVYPPIFPPPPVPQVEDVVSPVGPVADAGVLYPVYDDAVVNPLTPQFPFGADTYEAAWDFEVDQWGFRGGVGIRMHWLGR